MCNEIIVVESLLIMHGFLLIAQEKLVSICSQEPASQKGLILPIPVALFTVMVDFPMFLVRLTDTQGFDISIGYSLNESA